jgi:hypothetical protein
VGSVAIGYQAGQTKQSNNSIAIGYQAGQGTQGSVSIAIGYGAGQTNQQTTSISIGYQAGANIQGTNSIAIGYQAGYTGQQANSVAIGYQAGYTGQQTGSISIGYQAGTNAQGTNSIAIGYKAGQTNQHANSIILNASGTVLNSATSSSFYATPIRNDNNVSFNTLTYNSTNKEIVYNSTKTFVIQHPEYQNKYLVHACLEGPEAGVYYRGEGYCQNNTIVKLPDYVKTLAKELTIHLSIIQDVHTNEIPTISSTKVINGEYFKVFTSKPTCFNWLVMGKRSTIETEIEKDSVQLKNFGPYTWI